MDDSDLNAKFDHVDTKLERVDARFEQVDARFEQVDARFDKLEALIKAENVETRNQFRDEITVVGNTLGVRLDALGGHVDALGVRVDALGVGLDGLGVRVDTLHDQVKLVAEGHGALTAHIVDMKGGIERLEDGQTTLVLRVSVVESRLTDVEKTQKVMHAELRSFAARR